MKNMKSKSDDKLCRTTYEVCGFGMAELKLHNMKSRKREPEPKQSTTNFSSSRSSFYVCVYDHLLEQDFYVCVVDEKVMCVDYTSL